MAANGIPFNTDLLLSQVFAEKQEFLDLTSLFEEKLVLYDLSKRKVLGLLNMDQRTLDDILAGTAKQPSLINILKITQFLEIEDLNTVLAAILRNQDKENVGSIERAKNASFLAKHFDIKRLTAIGFFEDTSDTDVLVRRVLHFFGKDSIAEFKEQVDEPLYSKTKRNHVDKMKNFWVRSAYSCFASINNPNPYDRETLKKLIANIRPYCQDVDDGLYTVCRALYNIGVTVIAQNHLTLTQVRGGTFLVNEKPCIVLTDLNKRYTTIWETLIHELYHVLYDLDGIATTGYHLTGDPDLLLIEENAEEFSREYFCGFENYKFIKPQIHNHYLVERFANKIGIHPAFIYSAYRQFEHMRGKNYYSAFTQYFPDHAQAIGKLNPVTWKEESVDVIAVKLKNIFELNTSS